MKLLKTFLAAISFMAISISAYAVPATGVLTISDGTLNYDVAGDGDGSAYDTIFGDDVWTYWGSFDFSASLTGTEPAFGEDVNWYLSGEGEYNSLTMDGQAMGGASDSFGPMFLGNGSADDVFGAGITDYADILPAFLGALSATPTLTDVIVALNNIIDPAFALTLPLPTFITDISDYVWVSLNGNTISYVSNLGLTYMGQSPSTASVNFSGSLTLTAVPEPGALGLLGLGLIGFAMVIRRKRLAA